MATGDRNSDTAVYDALCDATDPPEAGCSCGWKGDADAAEDHDCSLPDHDVLQPIPVIAPEPAVVRIAKALAALAEALPGVNYVAITRDAGYPTGITIACVTDEATRRHAASAGREVSEVGNATHRWLTTGPDYKSPISISFYGPHHKIVAPAPIDEARVTAALSQAEAAL
jgi:hypothetical protein